LWIAAACALGCGGRVAVEEQRPDAGIVGADTALDASPRSIAEACAEQSDVLCRDLDACGSFIERWRFADDADCRSKVRTRCETRARLRGIVDPVALVDGCTHAVAEERCSEAREDAFNRACEEAVGHSGSLVDGSQCLDHAQCVGGGCDGVMVPIDPTCGTCKRMPRVGDPCSSDAECTLAGWLTRTISVCDPATRRCVRAERRKEGEPCGVDDPCASGLSCREGLCVRVELVGVGAVCDLPGDPPRATLRWCRGDAYCGFSGTCVRARVGASCSRVNHLACGWSATCARGELKAGFVCIPNEEICF
jgi:hypothetical protein